MRSPLRRPPVASRLAAPRFAAPLLAASVLASALVAPPARAQLTTFTSRAAFAAAAGPLATESFDMPFDLVPAAGGTFAFAGGTLTFDANHGGQTLGGGDAFLDVHPAGGGAPQLFRVAFAGQTTAFGADFSLFDAPGILLRLAVGGTTFDVGEGFFGVVSTMPFDVVELRDPTAETFLVLDDLSFAATPSAVPEPGTVGLLLVGLAAGGLAIRRRKEDACAVS